MQVYSPHSAVDATPGGLGDWLADIVSGAFPYPVPDKAAGADAKGKGDADGGKRPPQAARPGLVRDYSYTEPHYPVPSTVNHDDTKE